MGRRGSAGRFKGASAGISACVPAVSAARIAGGGVAVARKEDGAAIGPGLSSGLASGAHGQRKGGARAR